MNQANKPMWEARRLEDYCFVGSCPMGRACDTAGSTSNPFHRIPLFSNPLFALPLIWIGYGVLNQSDIGEWLSLSFEIPYFVATGDGMERVFDAAACDWLSRRGAGIRGLSLRGGSLCGWLEMVSSAWWDENRL